jgi:hypothetical protein
MNLSAIPAPGLRLVFPPDYCGAADGFVGRGEMIGVAYVRVVGREGALALDFVAPLGQLAEAHDVDADK